MLTLYKNIKDLRKQNHWTQEELAQRMGYKDRSTIAKIEAGQVDLSRSKIIQFAQVFGVEASELMGDDGISESLDTIDALLIREIYKHFTPEELDDPVLVEQICEFLDFLKKLDSRGRDSLLAFARNLKL